MVAAELEFDVTDPAVCAAVVASHDGPVASRFEDLRSGPDDDPEEPPLFVAPIGRLSVRM
jgi:hypothetical protein